ncbi:hypothetical protein K469DRAFT_687879 [Zopfia rhizophila CBS 207.26]|uniref:Uncharacterized protein n=1 Tax=Zopfia rhizophila CBS 207.26 TaxID=1314779 RepID=A0A6A6E0T8_9PEZI|nr:hypothetical protein K469DRAFT_687879 [Zopfia rhizophila CBS 207.26]
MSYHPAPTDGLGPTSKSAIDEAHQPITFEDLPDPINENGGSFNSNTPSLRADFQPCSTHNRTSIVGLRIQPISSTSSHHSAAESGGPWISRKSFRDDVAENLNPRSARTLACTFHKNETVSGRERSCRGINAANMSDITRHITQVHKKQVAFLKLCRTCQGYFIDQQEFEEFHGNEGRHCDNPRPNPRGKAVPAQWKALYNLLHPDADWVPSPYNGDNLHALPLEPSSLLSSTEIVDETRQQLASVNHGHSMSSRADPQQLQFDWQPNQGQEPLRFDSVTSGPTEIAPPELSALNEQLCVSSILGGDATKELSVAIKGNPCRESGMHFRTSDYTSRQVYYFTTQVMAKMGNLIPKENQRSAKHILAGEFLRHINSLASSVERPSSINIPKSQLQEPSPPYAHGIPIPPAFYQPVGLDVGTSLYGNTMSLLQSQSQAHLNAYYMGQCWPNIGKSVRHSHNVDLGPWCSWLSPGFSTVSPDQSIPHCSTEPSQSQFKSLSTNTVTKFVPESHRVEDEVDEMFGHSSAEYTEGYSVDEYSGPHPLSGSSIPDSAGNADNPSVKSYGTQFGQSSSAVLLTSEPRMQRGGGGSGYCQIPESLPLYYCPRPNPTAACLSVDYGLASLTRCLTLDDNNGRYHEGEWVRVNIGQRHGECRPHRDGRIPSLLSHKLAPPRVRGPSRPATGHLLLPVSLLIPRKRV